MTNNIAIDRITIRRNVTFTQRPDPRHVDALVRNGFRYDERAQQWWKVEQASSAPAADRLAAWIDQQEHELRMTFDFGGPDAEQHRYRFQSHCTPAPLAADLAELAGIEAGMLVLEPSAGGGAIAAAIRDRGGEVTCVEVDADACIALSEDNFQTVQDDFLGLRPGDHSAFDRVVMNPPFSRDQDARHVTHAFGFLKTGGRLIAVVGSYALNGRGREREAFARLLGQHGRVVRDVPPGTFDNNARAVIVELVKPCPTNP